MNIHDYDQTAKKLDDESSIEWSTPQSLNAQAEFEDYPLDALPEAIRNAVQEVAGFVKAPVAMVAQSALTALSLAAQTQADVKRADKLHGPAGLFLLTIADSGERKSTCDGFFTKSIRDYEQAQAEANKPQLKDYKAEMVAWESKRQGVKDKIRQETKAGKSTKNFELKLRELEYAKPELPLVPRLLYTDATPEALAYGLAKYWPSGGVVSAEAGIVFGSHGMGKDSVMRNLGLLNQLWDGASLTIDRRTSESFTVRGARLTIALQVQEPTLREFFSTSGALARGIGFLARFLLAWPLSTQGRRPFTDPPINWPHLEAFNQRIAEILARPVPIDAEGALVPPLMPLSPDAKVAWVRYHDAIESELANAGEYHEIRDVASKSADNAARLAALFQIFIGPGQAISEEAFHSASKITAWHLGEALRFFKELSLTPVQADSARLDRWLRAYCNKNQANSVNKTFTRQHGPIRDVARLNAAIAELTNLGRVRLKTTNRHQTIQINPVLVFQQQQFE
jgi:putative DNA primase/helicase